MKQIYLRKENIQINNQEIQWNRLDDRVKYLELHLDEKLTWKFTNFRNALNCGYTKMEILYPQLNITQPFK